jgi:hypothetical protein
MSHPTTTAHPAKAGAAKAHPAKAGAAKPRVLASSATPSHPRCDATKDLQTAGPPKGQHGGVYLLGSDASPRRPFPLEVTMSRSFLLSTVALAGALALGCGDQPDVTDPAPNAAPSFGAEISRFEQPLIVFQGQAEPPLAAHLGVSLEDFPLSALARSLSRLRTP